MTRDSIYDYWGCLEQITSNTHCQMIFSHFPKPLIEADFAKIYNRNLISAYYIRRQSIGNWYHVLFITHLWSQILGNQASCESVSRSIIHYTIDFSTLCGLVNGVKPLNCAIHFNWLYQITVPLSYFSLIFPAQNEYSLTFRLFHFYSKLTFPFNSPLMEEKQLWNGFYSFF